MKKNMHDQKKISFTMHDQKIMSFFNYLVLTILVWNMFGYEFVSSYNAGEELRCVEREREALLRFKKGLVTVSYRPLSSWGSEDDKKECCEWEGIRCGNTTGHVTALFLNGLSFHDISSALLELHHLEDLDLSLNIFERSRFPEFICSMTQLQHLNLSASRFSGIIPPQIGNLSNLQTLDLSQNDFGMSKIPESIGSMKKLEELNLGFSNFSGTIPPQLGNLTNLKTLDLSSSDFGESKIPELIGSMKKLELLNLRWCNLSGIVPFQLGNLTNLQTLDLHGNYLLIIENLNWLNSHLPFLSRLDFTLLNITDPNWLQYLLNLPSLREISLQECGLIDAIKPSSAGFSVNFSSSIPSIYILDLSENDLTSSTIDWLLNHDVASSLRELHLQSNKMKWLPSSIWQLPKLEKLDVSFNLLEGTITEANLTNPHNLRELDLSSNKLKRFPSSIWQLSKLEKLDLSFNLLEGTITEANFKNFQNMRYLDLTFNSLILRLDPNWTPPFQLDFINFGGYDVGPNFPLWLRNQSNLQYIDLSFANLTGEVPKWFWNLSVGLLYLNLSHNHLTGIISDFSPPFLSAIDVSSNNFSGPIPLFTAGLIQLSQNMFSGTISSAICAIPRSFLYLIDLSDNQLIGELPNCWENMTDLLILNLANNNFSGEIPRALGSLSRLWTLQLGNNKFSGELPSTLKNCTYLQLIDVGGNMLTGNIPSWIGAANHETTTIFIFRNNRFEGSIPPQICSLTQTQVLDLSGNHLTGKIPPCFNNFTFLVQMNTKNLPFWVMSFDFPTTGHPVEYVYSLILSWKGQNFEYRRDLGFQKLIDLSRNRLVGDIPQSLFTLRGLISLNLSRNSLTGIIHPDIGEMKMLEVLDLSSNQLSGSIPNGMAQLHFLAVLDFANNSLSGKIPIGGQLNTFNANSYAGNTAGLCGSPLPLCPGEGSENSINNKAGVFDDDYDDDGILRLSFLKEIGISVILGFITGFWGVVGSLIVSDTWRRAFYNFWGAVWDWLYVTATISCTKLRRS